MPLSSYSQQWKEWCSGANPQGWICDAIRFRFDDGSSIAIANKLPIQPQMMLTHENGTIVSYTLCGFLLSMPVKQLTTEYQLDINMMPVNNELLSIIVNYQTIDLLRPIVVEHRTYLLPNAAGAPAIIPPSRYYVGTITTSRDAINVACLPPTLGKKRAGTAYRIEEFAGLARI